MSVRGGVGVLGGTFDPVHVGHLVLASEVHHALGLAEVVLVPAGRPWQKAGQPVSPAADRLRMTELAVEGDPRFRVSRVDVDRPGPTYTVDTVRDLRAELAADTEVVLIAGSDTVAGMPEWHEVERLMEQVRVAVVGRPGHPLELPDRLPADRFLDVPTTALDVSSSDLRARVRAGAPVRYLVPPAVDDYVRAQRLYRSDR